MKFLKEMASAKAVLGFNFTPLSIILTAQKIMADFTVRDKGYSDYFVDLGEDLQNEIIRRTEHTGY
ncbi:MAG: hypothetical protein WC879_03135 [Melioribacteraceae bacterium]